MEKALTFFRAVQQEDLESREEPSHTHKIKVITRREAKLCGTAEISHW